MNNIKELKEIVMVLIAAIAIIGLSYMAVEDNHYKLGHECVKHLADKGIYTAEEIVILCGKVPE